MGTSLNLRFSAKSEGFCQNHCQKRPYMEGLIIRGRVMGRLEGAFCGRFAAESESVRELSDSNGRRAEEACYPIVSLRPWRKPSDAHWAGFSLPAAQGAARAGGE